MYCISGYTTDVGLWETELFHSKKQAEQSFNYYCSEWSPYQIDKSKKVTTAYCNNGSFSMSYVA